MAADPVKTPPALTVRADNWFHLGWIEQILGLPHREFTDPDAPVSDADIDAYTDGYEMARETFDVGVTTRAMILRRQLVIDRPNR